MNFSWCVAILVCFSAVSCSPFYDTKGKETLDFASNKRDLDTDYDTALTLLSLHDQVDPSYSNSAIEVGLAANDDGVVPLTKKRRLDSDPSNNELFAMNADEAFLLALDLTHVGNTKLRKVSEDAWQWYLKAAELGHPIAQYIVGVNMCNGWNVKQDGKAALFWLIKATENKTLNPLPFQLMEKFYTRFGGYVYQLSEDDTLIDDFRVEAAIRIREIYRKGKAGVTQNLDEAQKWQKFAESIDNPKKQSSLILGGRSSLSKTKQKLEENPLKLQRIPSNQSTNQLPSFCQLIQEVPLKNETPIFTRLASFSHLVQSMKNVRNSE